MAASVPRHAIVAILVLAAGIAIGIGLGDRVPAGRLPLGEAAEPFPEARADLPAMPSRPPVALNRQTEIPQPPTLAAPRPAAVAPRQDAVSPPWRRFAVAAPATEGRVQLAIVMDDLGLDRNRTERLIRLPGPLTLSFMTYAEELTAQTAAAHAAGHELMLHVPMEPLDRNIDPGPNGLYTGLSHEEVQRRLRWGLDRFSGYVGINNHMGSRFTSNAAAMTPVIEELRGRGLLFLDSRTTPASVAEGLAREMGVPHAARNVFLDNEANAGALQARLGELEQVAHRRGTAIAIGHPYDVTIEALSAWLPTLAAKHIALVPLSTIVRENEIEATKTAAFGAAAIVK